MLSWMQKPIVAGSRARAAHDPVWRIAISGSCIWPVILLAVLFFPSPASADLLGVMSNSWEGGGAFIPYSNSLYFAFGNFYLKLGWSDQFGLTNAVYDTYAFTTNDVGRVFYLTAAEDPDFTVLASNLVNGQADRIGYTWHYSPIYPGDPGTQQYEDYMLAGSPFLTNGIDLQGTVIDGFSLRINDLTLDSPGSDLNGDGNWTDLRFSMTLSIEGHVIPEPSTLFLCFTGLAALLQSWIKRRFR